jgi:hypothetical protein
MDTGLGQSAAIDRTLSALVRERGAAAWSDPNALDAFLREAVAGQGGRIDLLVAAVELGLVAELAATSTRDSIAEARFAQRLVFERYYSDSDARFAVEAWARALHDPPPPAEAPAPSGIVAAATPQPSAPAPRPEPARRRASVPSQVFGGADLGEPEPSPYPGRRSDPPKSRAEKSKGRFARLKPLLILGVVLFMLANFASQCDLGDAPTSSSAESEVINGITAEPGSPEAFAMETLGYQEAISVTASQAIEGLGVAPEPIRKFVASYAADPANSGAAWLAVSNVDNAAGYVILSSAAGDYAAQLIVVRDTNGKYSLSGPLAAGIPSQ